MPADASLLADLDPFALLDVECRRVDRFWSVLPASGWARPTRCSAWTVRDMLGHLAFCEDYNRAGLDGTVAELAAVAAAEGANSEDELNAWGVARRAVMPTDEVLMDWRAANAAFRREIRARGRHGMIDSMVGPYPSWQQAFYLAAEYAAHGDDMGVGVPASEVVGRDRWRARFTRYALAEYERPVTVTVVDELNVVRGCDAEARLSDHDLADAGVARLPAGHPIPDVLRAVLGCLA